jgi:Kef-type K+ transport system membrane component KefB
MVLPFLLGSIGALAFGVAAFPALFIGATLTATSIGVTAAVLEELGVSTQRAATLILAVAVFDDVLGLVVLAALIGMISAQGGIGLQIALAVVQAIGFLGVAIWLGRPLTQATIRLTQWAQSRSMLFVVIFSVLLLTAWAAKSVGLEMIIGAYAAGLAVSRHPEREWLKSELGPVIELFTPIFFVLVGSAVSLEHLAISTPSGRLTLALAGVLFAAAVAGKLLAPMATRELDVPALAVGSALVPRGEVGLVFAQIGLSEGVLDQDLFAALALVITATTLVGPVLLRRLWPPTERPSRETQADSITSGTAAP